MELVRVGSPFLEEVASRWRDASFRYLADEGVGKQLHILSKSYALRQMLNAKGGSANKCI
jgi:hypothetical protein